MVIMEEDRASGHPSRGAFASRPFDHLSLHQITLLGADGEESTPDHRPMEKDEQVVQVVIMPELVRIVALHQQLTLRRGDREARSAQHLFPPPREVEGDDPKMPGRSLNAISRRQTQELLRATLPPQQSQGCVQQHTLVGFESPRGDTQGLAQRVGETKFVAHVHAHETYSCQRDRGKGDPVAIAGRGSEGHPRTVMC